MAGAELGCCHLNYTLDFQSDQVGVRKEGVMVERSLCDLMFTELHPVLLNLELTQLFCAFEDKC